MRGFTTQKWRRPMSTLMPKYSRRLAGLDQNPTSELSELGEL